MRGNYENLDTSFLNKGAENYIETQTEKMMKKFPKLSERKVRALMYCYIIIKEIANGVNIKTECTMRKDIPGIGYIDIIGRNIAFKDPDKFKIVRDLANNFEVCPRTDGVIELSFAFNNLF